MKKQKTICQILIGHLANLATPAPLQLLRGSRFFSANKPQAISRQVRSKETLVCVIKQDIT